jgi:hypothetical protein
MKNSVKGSLFVLEKEDEESLKKAKELVKSKGKEFGEPVARKLHDSWKKFYRLPPYQERGLYMNYSCLSQAAISCSEDMLRIKSYQELEHGDRHKLAAYLFKWLSRMRPIKPVTDNNADLEEKYLFANAYFALSCAQSVLECSDFGDEEIKYIRYSSTFRDIHAREWSMIFYLLEKCYPAT